MDGLRSDYRAIGFAACGGEEPPAWVPVEAPDGSERSEADATRFMDEWWGPTDDPWRITRVSMYVGEDEHGDLRVHPDPEGMTVGAFEFWKFDEE